MSLRMAIRGTTSRGWLAEPVSSWHGITVINGRVTFIELSDNNLSGPLPSDLGVLTGLDWLDVTNNQLSGAIPADLAAPAQA